MRNFEDWRLSKPYDKLSIKSYTYKVQNTLKARTIAWSDNLVSGNLRRTYNFGWGSLVCCCLVGQVINIRGGWGRRFAWTEIIEELKTKVLSYQDRLIIQNQCSKMFFSKYSLHLNQSMANHKFSCPLCIQRDVALLNFLSITILFMMVHYHKHAKVVTSTKIFIWQLILLQIKS